MRSVTLTLSSVVVVAALSGCTVYQVAPPQPGAAPPPAAGPDPSATPPAEPAGWDLLGSRQVKFTVDHDLMAVNPTHAYRAIRLHVLGNALELYNIKVRFQNGEDFSPDTRLNFAQGSWSRDIDLPGDARHIRAIEFFYKSGAPGAGHAYVHAFGKN